MLKLVEPNHNGVGRSLVLAPKVKEEIKNLFVNEYMIFLTNRGHLYITDISTNTMILWRFYLMTRLIG